MYIDLTPYAMEPTPIGEGSFATVHRAKMPATGQPVAVKLLKPELAANPAMTDQFETEFSI